MSSTLGDPSSSQNQTSVSSIFPNLHRGQCDKCNSQPQKWYPHRGQHSNCCSDSCAIGSILILRVSQLDSNLAGHQKTSTGVNCNHCMQSPSYTHGTTVHPYCRRTCAKLAKCKGPADLNAPAPTSYVNTANPFAFASPTRGTTPGDITGALGITPPTNSRNGFGSVNRRKSVLTPSVLMPINFHTSSATRRNNRSTVYGGLPLARPACLLNAKPLCTLVQTDSPANTVAGHTNSRGKAVACHSNLIEAKGKFTSKGKSRGNENRRWHGTTRVCNIGDKGVTRFCSNPSCSLCCIMRTSFDLSFFAKKTSVGRFGAGIYTSSTSSKSDTYSQNSCISQWKAMLLNRVVVGKGYKMKVDNTALTEPPAGYDSLRSGLV